jgi:hypothetical protein
MHYGSEGESLQIRESALDLIQVKTDKKRGD